MSSGGGGATLNYHKVLLSKDEDNPSFGFNIKGGSDFGTPIHIFRVEPNSLADSKGLKRGQRIIQANGVAFDGISHASALKVLKNQRDLSLVLEMNSPPSTPLSIPHSHGHGHGHPHSHSSNNPFLLSHSSTPNSSYTWIDNRGHPAPPPSPSLNNLNKRILNLDINPGQSLGLMIRGGAEYGLGIYVTGVDPGSVAQRAGLQRGDLIIEVNGRPFTSITHDKAVQILKSCRKMNIVATHVGVIPADNLEDSTELIDLGGKLVTSNTSFQSVLMDETNLMMEEELRGLELDFGGVDDVKSVGIMGMIEEKARTVLTKSEHSRFTFYRLEYQQGFLPIQTFVRILLELLNTAEKYTLLTEVREIIRPNDLPSFDELIYNKGASLGLKKTLFKSEMVPRNYNDFNESSSRPALLDTQQQQQQQQQQNVKKYPPPENSCVRYKIRVQKTKPILGIAIEGGVNTPHRLPRVIDVNTEGSAHSHLKPGQVLLAVDGKKLDGLTHEEIARCILDCYSTPAPQIEFLVVEAKSSFVKGQT